ncbi:DoxX family protein [Sphaerisporangium sp. NPDC049002]|uniref:DoxX family protein n=1 Tax=unclassified Sphaerisporangium TaxID=2630420 RepID=UPI0033C647ED
MNVFLWILQVLLALAFGMAGVLKTTQPKEKLAANMGWVEDFSAGTVKFIGGVEFLAALGLILPAVTGIATVLTPLAATGLVLVMIGAIVVHVRRGEIQGVVINVVLLVLSGLVAWGRFGPYHF